MERKRKIQEKINYDKSQEPIVISKVTSDIILKQDRPADLMALYWFYYQTAKWQKTEQVRATTSYVAQGLKWGKQRVREAKKELVKLGLIENITTRNKETNLITGHYIYIKFIWWDKNKIDQVTDIHTLDIPQCGKGHTVESKETNALSTNNLNSLNTNKTIYIHFLEFWNKQNIIVHSKITSKRKKVIDKILKNNDYSNEEIFQAFKNYSIVLNSPDYYWDHKWSIEEFLVRGLDRFVDESLPLEVFKVNNNQTSSKTNKNDNPLNNPLNNPTHKSLHLFPKEKIDLFLEEIKTVANKWMNLECWEHGYKPSKSKIYEALLKQKVWLNNLMTGDNLHLVDDWENRVFNSTARRNLGTLTQLSNHYFEWIDGEGAGISLNNEQVLFPDSKTFKRFMLIESDILGVDIQSRGWGEHEHLCIETPHEKIQRCIDNAEELEKKYIIKELIEDNTKENIKWAENCIMEVLTDYEIKINNININWFNEHISDFIGGRKNNGDWKIKFKKIFVDIENKYQLDPTMRKNGYLSSFYNLSKDTIQEILKPTFIPYEKCYFDLPDRRKIYELNTVKDDEDNF